MRIRISASLIFAFVFFLMAGAAWAVEYDVAASLAAIDADSRAQTIAADQTAMFTAYALFAADKLPTQYHMTRAVTPRLLGAADTGFCATPAVQRLQAMLPGVSPNVRAAIEKMMLPGERRGEALGDAKALSDNPDGVATPNHIYVGHFAVRWGDSLPGNLTQDELTLWATVADTEVWPTEVTSWNYPNISLTDQYYIDLYVGNSGSGVPTIDFSGAYTTIYQNTYQPYIVFYPDLLTSSDATREVTGHEFFHTIQFTLGIEGTNEFIFGNDNTWFVEGSAVWAQDVAYPQYKGYIGYIPEWAQNPSEALTNGSEGGGLAPYARGIWLRYLYEHYSGLDTIHNLWTTNRGTNALYGNTGYLQTLGKSWNDTWFDFGQKVISLDFADGSSFPTFQIYRVVSQFPYVQASVGSSDAPHINSLHMIEVQPGSVTDPKLNIRFIGATPTIPSVDWGLAAVKYPANGAPAVEILAPTAAKGDFTVDGLGTTYAKIYLMITPVSGSVDNANAYWDYSLEMTRGNDPFPPLDDDASPSDDDTAPADDDDDNDDNDDTSNVTPSTTHHTTHHGGCGG